MNKEVILTKEAPAPVGPYNQAIKTGNLIFTAGQIAINPATNKVEETTIEGQTTQVIKNLEAILKTAGSDLSKVIKTTVFLKNMADFPKMNGVYAQFFIENPPARSTVEVGKLPLDVMVEIECIAIQG